jgi:hypothetical protein
MEAFVKRSTIVLLVFVGLKFLIIVATTLQSDYGIFRDEFYYLACAKRLAWGYVDQPPFSIGVLRLWTLFAGDSLLSLRILSGLLGAGIVLLSGLLTQQLGGGIKAQILACIGVLAAPIQLGIASFYSMNVIEYLLVLAAVSLLLKIVCEQRPIFWIPFGIILGLGIMNKHTFGVLAAFMLAGILFTPDRKEFLKKNFWIGMGLAFLLVLPNILWQAFHHFPSLEFYARAQTLKNVATLPVKIIAGQIISGGVVTAILWIAGLIWFLIGKERKRYRWMSIAFLLMLAMMIQAQSNRTDRIASFIPVLVAGGSVLWERMSEKKFFGWTYPLLVFLMLVFGLLAAPIALPVLNPGQTAEYLKKIGMEPDHEKGISASLPQNLADRIGWKEFADSAAAVYHRLPEDERTTAVIVGGNYGEAGSLEYYRRSVVLPRIISNHNSYWMWGPGQPAEAYLVVGNSRKSLEKLFNEVSEGGRTPSGFQMNYECNRPIWICRHPKNNLDGVWSELKMYI